MPSEFVIALLHADLFFNLITLLSICLITVVFHFDKDIWNIPFLVY